mmetsp:Transcript_36456/g.66341  ORF Transcript_36456/g.66341 Transcript_36456/m.66341 type:complete len:284 (+) Transcript_36456:526-1377(+)
MTRRKKKSKSKIKEMEEANEGWLTMFKEELEKVQETQGFILLVQDGIEPEKSDLQLEEEKQDSWLQMPRIGMGLHPEARVSVENVQEWVCAGSYLLDCLGTAIEKSDGQWEHEIATAVMWCNKVYEGDRNDRGDPHGIGRKVYPTGNSYEGQYEDGKRSGQGKYTYASGDVYEGEWKEGAYSGLGKFTYASGAVYEGEWAEGVRSGKGKYTYKNGKMYKGEFVAGTYSGKGRYINARGGVYEGEFKDGTFSGLGTYIYASGKVDKGVWQDGKLIENHNLKKNP